jgi:hypothetical protein
MEWTTVDRREAMTDAVEVLTKAEIEARFKDEWVLLGDPEVDPQTDTVAGGKVLAHSKDRDEVYRQAIALRPRYSAVLYTGTIPDGTAVVL